MTNPSESQRQRSQYNPLNLGTFEQTSLRLLTGSLGMRSQIVQGGYGNYTYNHWFQVTLPRPAWIICLKAGTKLSTSPASFPDRFQDIDSRFDVGVYAQDYSPIQGRVINQEPERYFGHVAGAQSDLYNTFNSTLDAKGNEMFYELEPGNYLICVSATRNEPFDYALGLVIEFSDDSENFILTEDQPLEATSFVLQEDFNPTQAGVFDYLASPITSNTTINPLSRYTIDQASINAGVYVQVDNKNSDDVPLVWLIGPGLVQDDDPLQHRILLDFTETWPLSTPHGHSLNEWRRAWQRDHAQEDKFPSGVFAPFTNQV
jgi:hypothetical protein